MLSIKIVELYLVTLCCAITTVSSSHRSQDELGFELDSNGYIVYCPCMGRFGNQAEHFLGSIAFAKLLNRTLVLPPWPAPIGHVPFDDWFKVDAIAQYHKVVTADTFMNVIALEIWPVGKRIGFCYHSPHLKPQGQCKLKEGSPFGPFWNHLEVDFDTTMFYSLTYTKEDKEKWDDQFPASEYPVLAFKGAPASFPVQGEHRGVHEYMWWSSTIERQTRELIFRHFGSEKFVGLHLRNGPDWYNVCQHAVGSNHDFMSSVQCFGYHSGKEITRDVCSPSNTEVIRKARQALVLTGARYLYVATDKTPLVLELNEGLKDLNVTAVHADPDLAQLDLAVLAQADMFVGNCLSSFTAFVKRERDYVTNKPSMFFGLD